MLQHVLNVLVFWSWALLLPRLPPWSRSLRLIPCASVFLYGPLDIAWVCCLQLPHHLCKNGTHSTCFYSTGGHTPTQKSLKIPIFGPFWVFCSVFLDLFGYFLRLFSRPPERSFLRLFLAISGPEGPETPVNGGSGSQVWSIWKSDVRQAKEFYEYGCQNQSFSSMLSGVFPLFPSILNVIILKRMVKST